MSDEERLETMLRETKAILEPEVWAGVSEEDRAKVVGLIVGALGKLGRIRLIMDEPEPN